MELRGKVGHDAVEDGFGGSDGGSGGSWVGGGEVGGGLCGGAESGHGKEQTGAANESPGKHVKTI